MTSKPGKKCCGFTLFEFAVGAGLFGVFVAALLSRVLFYQGEAERVAAEQLVGALRTALEVRTAQTIAAAGGEQGLARIAEENPIGWLAHKPRNYLGEYYAPPLDELPLGNWFYDRNDKTLVYLPASHKSFSFQTSKFLKFKVKLLRLPNLTQIKGQSKINKGLSLDQVSDSVADNN
jgi:general secretion pathway protein G